VLKDSPIDVVLLATDLAAAKDFYADKLGLETVSESEASLTFRCGGDGRLLVTQSTTGTADSQTQAQWRVDDIHAVVADLRSRGVKPEQYDSPGLKTVDGVADVGWGYAAWIVDPGKNTLAIIQYK
jgi:catechol 2,3-dioxygenase-like lactoylglutathione lyase family enzyme